VEDRSLARRLAAILVADIVGYSRLMGHDEVGTLRAVQAWRRDTIDPAIARHHGRIVKTTGDGVLAEFDSAVDAVHCAVVIQRAMALRAAGEPPEARIVLRIGINVGDIILEKGDIFGDGVNVAARLETLCEPGGICISRSARDQVRDRLPLAFTDLGERTVKNIARPVRAFGLDPAAIAASPDFASDPEPRAAVWFGGRIAAIAAGLAILLAAGGAALLTFVPKPAAPGPAADASVETPAATRASVAVLPLNSLADGSNDDYFADGLTEDIIAALGRFPEISVISRQTAFTLKGKPLKPDQIGRELGVRYIVEGSVRRRGDRVRVWVGLTDSARGALLWSEQYDAELKDIFTVQNDITRRVAGSLAVRLSNVELAKAATKPTSSLEAYDLVLRGRDLTRRGTRTANSQARGLFESAIMLDPTYVAAYVGLGVVEHFAVSAGWTGDPAEAIQRALKLAEKAIAIDPTSAGAHALLGLVFIRYGDYDRAVNESKRAVAFNASDAESYERLGMALLWTGEIDQAIAALETAAQLQPNSSVNEFFHLGTAYLLAERQDDAIRTLESALVRYGSYPFIHVVLAAAYAVAGRQDDATREVGEVRRLYPGFAPSEFGSQFRNPAHRDTLIASLRKAGF